MPPVYMTILGEGHPLYKTIHLTFLWFHLSKDEKKVKIKCAM